MLFTSEFLSWFKVELRGFSCQAIIGFLPLNIGLFILLWLWTRNSLKSVANAFPFNRRQKKIHFGGSLSAAKCYLYKAWPGNYQIFLLPGMWYAFTHIRLCIQPKSGKIYRFFFNFRKAFLSLNRDKYFTLYWCFVLGFPL